MQLSVAVLLGFRVLRNRRFSCDGAEITEEYVVLSLDPDNMLKHKIILVGVMRVELE